MMMNDFAIKNIHRILENEIANGGSVIGLISIDKNGRINLCWRTDDTATASKWEGHLMESVQAGVESRDFLPLNDPQ